MATMGRQHLGWSLVLAAALGLGACSGPSGTEVVAADPEDAGPTDAADADRDVDGDAGEGDADGSRGDAEVAACDDATDAAVDATLRGQLEAFAADDYVTALTFASRDFQRDFDVDRFRDLITTDFAAIVDSTEHLVLRCEQVGGDVARVDVVITAADGSTNPLTYLFVEEDGRWVVAAAAHIPDRSVRT